MVIFIINCACDIKAKVRVNVEVTYRRYILTIATYRNDTNVIDVILHKKKMSKIIEYVDCKYPFVNFGII